MIDKLTIFLVVDDLEAMRQVTASQLRSLGANHIVIANKLDDSRIGSMEWMCS